MGYTTEFEGYFTLTPPLSPAQTKYIKAFSGTRRMQRNPAKLPPQGTHSEVGLGLGQDGGYFVDGPGFRGQQDTPDVVDHNTPPRGQPGLWCQWACENPGELAWNGGEKFYNYAEWLQYLIDHFFEPWGVAVSGEVEWQGNDSDDSGVISVIGNEVHVAEYRRSLGKAKSVRAGARGGR